MIFEDKSELLYYWTGQASVTGDLLSELELNTHSTAITTALLKPSTKYSLKPFVTLSLFGSEACDEK